MAKRKKNFFRNIKKNKSIFNSISLPEMPRIDLDPEVKRGILSIFLLTLGAIGVLGLFDMAGLLGQYYIKLTAAILGWGKAYLPFLMIILGYLIYKKDEHEFKPANYFGLFLLILSFQTLLELFVPRELWKEALAGGYGGGYVGYYLGGGSIRLMGIYASYLVAIALILVSLMLFLERNLSALIGAESPLSFIYGFFSYIAGKFRREEADEGEEKEGEEREEEEDGADEEEAEKEAEDGEDEEEEDEEEEPEFEKHDIKTFVLEAKRVEPSHWKKSGVRINIPLDLLSAKISKPTSGDINANKTIIERTLINFNIPVEMAEVSVGPTVTQYTFKPADGIKLSRITNLSNDLALALAAHPIRIEAPIPGRSLVGIEVPNHAKAIVGLREILTSREFLEKKSNSMIALGKDVTAKAWIYDLTKMPHLLVAGATGSGKSVCLNSIIVSLLYQNSPDDLRFIMVDPKRVELPVYNGIPHLCAPVITDVEKTINALRWCLNEMDKRLDILNKTHKRDIQGYNMSVKEKLPYIVFIIDELADLMVVSSKEVETAVIRLAQMARAVGIHLILATQRPSVNVITGLIKTNMPVRIAFSVPQSVDSRTILDSLGAEKLLGSGDMLFLSPEISKPKRLQGAFVSELEVKRIVRFIKDQVDGPNYIEGITEKQKVKGIAGTGMNKYNSEDSDELFEEAKEVVINIGRASTSLLQRKLSIGYGRAAKLIDLLEAAGIVGAANGSKPREILVSKDEYARMGSVGISGVPLHRREERTAPDEYLDGDLDEEEEEDEGEEEQNEEDAESEIEDEEENEKEAEHKNEDKKRERANERPENVRRTSRDPGQNKQRAEKNSFDKDHDFRLFSK